jgi:hypothetical protein
MTSHETPAVVVGSLAEARLAAGCGAALTIVATPALGWAAVEALARLAGAEIVYDPGGRAGPAADALQRGARAVVFPADDPQYPALAALAETCGARLLPPPADPLVLALEQNAVAALAQLLAARHLR